MATRLLSTRRPLQVLSLASAALLAAASAGAQGQAGPLVVSIGVRSTPANPTDRPGGTLAGIGAGKVIAGDSFFDQCLTRGNVNLPVPPSATHSWHFTGRIASQTPREAVVELDWQRTRADGQPVSGVGGSKAVTVAAGDRVVIDEVTTSLAPNCTPRTLTFEVGFAPTGPPTFTVFAPGPRGAGPAPPLDESGLPRLSFVLTLTLVTSIPDAPDRTQGLSVPIGAGGASVRFRPVPIPIDEGELSVLYVASLQYTNAQTLSRGFQIFAEPHVTFMPTGRTTPAQTTVGARRSFSGPIPAADQELTFPLPALTGPDGRTLPNRVLLKMKMTPR